MAEATRACVICGADISHRRRDATRCERHLRHRVRTHLQESATCANCGRFFGDELGRSGGAVRYCSADCRQDAAAKRRTACSFEGCGRATKYGGLCSGHAEQRRLGKPLTQLGPWSRERVPCTFQGCRKTAHAKGLCWGHFDQARDGRPLAPLRPRVPTGTHSRRNELGQKRCSACQQWKPLDQFARAVGKADGHVSACSQCCKIRRLAKIYGLSAAAYSAMLAAQGGRCGACGTSTDRSLAVDHDHACCPGKKSCGSCVRGLLCAACNMAIGSMGDSPDRLRAAAAYLERAAHVRRLEVI